MENPEIFTNIFDSVLNNGEKIIWQGRLKFIPFIIFNLEPMFQFFFSIVVFIGIRDMDSLKEFKSILNLSFIIFISKFIYDSIKRLFSYKNTFYCLTDARALISCVVGDPQIKSIDKSNILSSEIRYNFLDKFYKTGSIRFFSGSYEEVDENILKRLKKFLKW